MQLSCFQELIEYLDRLIKLYDTVIHDEEISKRIKRVCDEIEIELAIEKVTE